MNRKPKVHLKVPNWSWFCVCGVYSPLKVSKDAKITCKKCIKIIQNASKRIDT